jgi:hypothetical protein
MNDHNFLRFLPILGEKMSFFHKNQCYDHIFGENILNIITSVPDWANCRHIGRTFCFSPVIENYKSSQNFWDMYMYPQKKMCISFGKKMVGLNLGIFLKFIWSPWALNMYLKVPQIVQEVLTLMARPKQVQKNVRLWCHHLRPVFQSKQL